MPISAFGFPWPIFWYRSAQGWIILILFACFAFIYLVYKQYFRHSLTMYPSFRILLMNWDFFWGATTIFFVGRFSFIYEQLFANALKSESVNKQQRQEWGKLCCFVYEETPWRIRNHTHMCRLNWCVIVVFVCVWVRLQTRCLLMRALLAGQQLLGHC